MRRALASATPVSLFNKEHIMKRVRSSITALVCASMLVPLLPLAAAQAAPVEKTSIAKESDVTLVGRRGWGAGALIGGIVAGALIAGAVREGRADDRDMRRCARDFPHFSYRTGTWINRYGEERVCPYLR
jgi:hypothetical protein